MIPINGFVDDRYAGKRWVQGFAFQLRGWEFFRLWATPSLHVTNEVKWVVSHWDSGYSIGTPRIMGNSPQAVARKVRPYLKAKGVDAVVERLKHLGFAP